MKPIIANIKARIPSKIQKVWELVATPENYCAWRSDLRKTEILNEKQFIEYTETDIRTKFTIIRSDPYRRLEFMMESNSMSGRWCGTFTPFGDETEIDFTEYITVKNIFMRLLIKFYLGKQQSRFVSDIKKKLTRTECNL